MNSCAGKRVMVVEDSYYLAKEVKLTLQRAGYAVAGPFATARDALERLQQDVPDCAVLDVKLDGDTSFEVARELRRREIPFLFFTGYDAQALPAEFAGIRRLEKPVTASCLLKGVEQCW